AVKARLRTAPASVRELWLDEDRRDTRARDLLALAENRGIGARLADGARLDKMVGGARHQGVVAKVEALPQTHSLEEVLEGIEGPPLIVVLDGVTDPHNLGAVLRSADAFGAHAVIAPKDRAVGLNATVEKVACGAAETLPYLMVTNLTRSLNELKDHQVWTIAAEAGAPRSLAQIDAKAGIAWVLGAEGAGLRRLTRESCDDAARIPIDGSVDSLNVSVSAAICLYETMRQRSHHA
ncbi:MAG TPA: 23S rRNA (guanosine(2251)-2'-O)-methyltransferase RlmB, partial [Thiobacillaceae bacterium]|nr:23S rRNA (guanosine(2251)-2'-O)-methyltransferase RlmB [Thiobacillaceae bacterium]